LSTSQAQARLGRRTSNPPGILNLIEVKGRPALGYKATAQGYFADWDEGLDQNAQAASFFKMFGMTTPIISDSPPDNQ
jgi:hypothetical protein